jgi:hypothetical protein
MSDVVKKSTIGERSFVTEKAINILESVAEGDLITYQTLKQQTNIDFQISANRSCLRSAQVYLRKNANVVFGCIRGVGYKRLSPNEIAPHANVRVRRIRNQAKYASKELLTADVSRLTKNESIVHNSCVAIVDILKDASKKRPLVEVAPRSGNASPKVEF